MVFLSENFGRSQASAGLPSSQAGLLPSDRWRILTTVLKPLQNGVYRNRNEAFCCCRLSLFSNAES